MGAQKRRSSRRRQEPHLRVYRDRSELVFEDGSSIVFQEGRPSEEARERSERITRQLRDGWLNQLYEELPTTMEGVSLTSETMRLIDQIVESVTSEIGRAVAGLAILQLVIKCLEPSQSIRLHKGGTGDFSWREGISMRRLDSLFVTPFLRKHGLLRINKDGLFMTRSLAENYPYTQFYKAAVRGAKQAWLDLVDLIEADAVDSCNALRYLLAKLRNRAELFRKRTDYALEITHRWLSGFPDAVLVQAIILCHINRSAYSARLLEIGMHSFLQVLEDRKALLGSLLPLCQMRTANKKHRNIGDVEIVNEEGIVVEAWDAKYGKPYLLDELYELGEKLEGKLPEIVGFVVDQPPDMRQDIADAILSLQETTGVKIYILSIQPWLKMQVQRARLDPELDVIFREWVKAYVETLCQRRRERAPVDEPADQWVEDWISLIEQELSGLNHA